MITFQEALSALGPNDVVALARDARPGSEYLLNDILPETLRPTYDVGTATMTVKPTMAGLVGMDSAYPPGGAMSLTRFMENTAKMAINVPLAEATIRELQMWQMGQTAIGATVSKERVAQEALNFYQGVILQALWDRDEWLRGQVLSSGQIDWTFGDINLLVDYGLPAGHVLTARTVGNTDAYHLAGSMFWTDYHEARRLLRFTTGIVGIAHPDTIDAIIYNSANDIQVQSDAGGVFRLRRYTNIQGNTQLSDDARDAVTLIAYGQGGEVLDPTNGLDGSTTVVPFYPAGKITWIGSGRETGYRFTAGARPDPSLEFALGYHHMAPTVEGDGQPGRWGRLYTPEDAPWALYGQAVENSLPVITNPNRLVIASTELPS